VFDRLNSGETSLKYHMKALSIRKEINDKQGISNSMVNIGGMLFKKKNSVKR